MCRYLYVALGLACLGLRSMGGIPVGGTAPQHPAIYSGVTVSARERPMCRYLPAGVAVLTRSRPVSADIVPVALYPLYNWVLLGCGVALLCCRARGVVPAAPVIVDCVPVACTRFNLG